MRRKKEERKERKGEISITLARGNFETRFYRVRGEEGLNEEGFKFKFPAFFYSLGRYDRIIFFQSMLIDGVALPRQTRLVVDFSFSIMMD